MPEDPKRTELPEWWNLLSRGGKREEVDPAIAEMRKNRAVNRKLASSVSGLAGGGRGGAAISFATGRSRDPMWYWKQNNFPWDITKLDELKKLREMCRLLYMTHPVVASCVDIFAKFPLIGMEVHCKDTALQEFYSDLFLEQLNYEDFLIDVGREYWTVGEACTFGSFNELLGIWEADELLDPDDIEVIRSPFLTEPRFEMRLPEILREIIEKRSPKWEFEKLMQVYPELKHFVGAEARMPVSNVLLKQLKFKGHTFHPRGIPILMRAIRAITQEEMLTSAMDSVADRLYTPLLLAKLGASASDLGTQRPWVPTDDDLADFEEALDAAMAGDFRLLVYHFAVQLDHVYGREIIPNMEADFDRLTERILQVFGLSKTLLSGAGSGETYAADALNRDLVSQLLSVKSSMYAPILQPWRGIVLRTMEQIWDQAATYRPMIDDGQRQVIDLPTDNNTLYTLCFHNGMGHWGSIRRIIRHWYEGPMVRLCQKWGEVVVTPNHSVYTADGKLINPRANPELLVIRHLNQSHPPSEEEAVLSVPDCHVEGEWSYKHHKVDRSKLRHQLKGEDLQAFLRFLGAWISEGSVHTNKSGADIIQVSNTNRAWLEYIASGCPSFIGDMSANIVAGSVASEGSSQIYNLVMRNQTLGSWLRLNAGANGSHTKRLPDFVFNLTKPYVDVLLEAMIAGDGSIRSPGRWSYHTISEELAQGVGLLCTLHGIQFTVGKDERTGVYSINTCEFYISKKSNEKRICEETPYSGWVYDFEMSNPEIPNFTVGVGQPVVHNTTYQRTLRKLFHERAKVVAEAQEHWDYEERGGKRYPVMEEVLEVDEETGERRIVEQPKLLVPELKIKAMNLRDEDTLRQFYEQLRATGVPISTKTRLVNVPIDLDEEMERLKEEQIEAAVQAQRTRKDTFIRLREEGLPIPDDLRADFEPKAMSGAEPTAVEEQPLPSIGTGEPAPTMALAPIVEDYIESGGRGGNVVPLPRNQIMQRPPESDEMRAGMPTAASIVRQTLASANGEEEPVEDIDEGWYRLITGPRHIGKRRYVHLDPNTPLDEQAGTS